MPLQGVQQLACCGVPKTGGIIPTAREHLAAIRGEGDAVHPCVRASRNHSPAGVSKRTDGYAGLEEDAMKRVVVTGMGVVSCLGNSVEQVWARLIAGESGLAVMSRWTPAGCATRAWAK